MSRPVPDTLLKTDKCPLAMARLADGKIRLLTSSWSEPVVLLADQVLELRWRAGQVHLIRKPPIADAFDRKPDPDQAYLGGWSVTRDGQ